MQANWVICVELDGCDNWQTSESSTVKAVREGSYSPQIQHATVFLAAEILAVFSRRSDTPDQC